MGIETHSACDKRLQEMGDKAQCCWCVPHEGCGISVTSESEKE